jgi:hypothetical protein
MAQDENPIDVYVETGKTRTFAIALDWPGWCRSGRDETSALQTLSDYGARYAEVLGTTGLGFHAPSEASTFEVVERQTGNASTDFGAPNLTVAWDSKLVDEAELERWQILLQACWVAFNSAVQKADGHELRKGPRGGGRDLAKIIEHVRDVNASYLSSLGGKVKLNDQDKPIHALAPIREAILATLTAAVHGEIPTQGPRGGLRWTPRYFVRRLAWHELDHAWEIEDRVE